MRHDASMFRIVRFRSRIQSLFNAELTSRPFANQYFEICVSILLGPVILTFDRSSAFSVRPACMPSRLC